MKCPYCKARLSCVCTAELDTENVRLRHYKCLECDMNVYTTERESPPRATARAIYKLRREKYRT